MGEPEVNAVATDPVTLAYHELRGPLALMATAARSAAVESSDEYVRARCLTIVNAAERMLRTASQFLESATAAPSEEESAFRLRATVERVVEDYRALGAPVILDGCQDESTFRGSQAIVEALLASLLGNALDHSDLSMPIVVSGRWLGDAYVLNVRNTPAEEQRHRGFGLGSYISERLASQVGARLTTSTSSKCYSVTISFPIGSSTESLTA